jgi:hypothetical protein
LNGCVIEPKLLSSRAVSSSAISDPFPKPNNPKIPKMYIIHESSDLVCIATRDSDNSKTGNMIQLWIMARNVHPVESRRTGHDATLQCQGCPHASNQGCYVSPLALMAIWRAFKAGSYSHLAMGTPEWAAFFDGASVRLGAYGNPSMLPLAMLEDICARAYMHTGYFHDWHLMPVDLAKSYGRFLMASCEPSNVQFAQNLGLRTFTVVSEAPSDRSLGIECLSDTKGIQCIDCGLCDGTQRSNKRNKPLPSVWIKAHGYQVTKATLALN